MMENPNSPSPGPSLQHGLEEVEQFNNATIHQFENIQAYPEPYHLPPQYDELVPPVMASPHLNYDEPSNSPYPDPPLITYSTPPTSLSPHPSTTRSGRTIRSLADEALRPRPAGVSKSTTKARPRGKKKPGKSTGPAAVTEPLTTLLEHLRDVPETDIAQFVHRSTEDRQAEVAATKNNKIKRPMNAFMLYRKAWQNRVKAWQAHDNHQGVSKVCGDAWQYELAKVKDQFTDWARIERENHAHAFPHYKFTPSKAKKVNKKTAAGIYSDGEESEVDLDMFPRGMPPAAKRLYTHQADPNELDYRPSGRYAMYHQAPVSRATSHSPYGQMSLQQTMSHYQYSNPNKPMPPQYNVVDPHRYFSQRVVSQQQYSPQKQHHPPVYTVAQQPYQSENIFYHRTSTPSYHVQGNSLPSSYRGSPVQHDPMYDLSPHQQPPHLPMEPPPPYQQQQHFDGPQDDFLTSGPNHFDSALDELNGGAYEHDFGVMIGTDQGGLGQVVLGDESGFVTNSLQFDSAPPPFDDAIDPMLTAACNSGWDRTDLGDETNFDQVLGTASETREPTAG